MAKLTGTPAVGDGITIHGYSDSHAYTVVRVSDSGKTFWAQQDNATRTNGADDTTTPGGFFAHREGKQEWAYEPDPTAPEVRCTQRRTPAGFVWKTSHSDKTISEGRHEHYDYNF